eukprot:GILI01003295.1.p1 GENE.GILI01003295.1~~GILI01003295.1.p1  ORF type:complete len:1254 (+),score=296.00 GILI01003295.1:90-3851(+)
MGGPSTPCRAKELQYFKSGACVPLQTVDPTATRSVFVRVGCSTSSLINSRIQQLLALTGQTDIFESAAFVTVGSNLLPQPRSSTSEPFRVPYVAGSTPKESSSFTEGVLVSQATPSDFDNTFDAKRIVLQLSRCTFNGATTGACVSSEEAQHFSSMSTLSTTQYSPTTPDVPIGQIYGGYGTSDAITWSSAGLEAHRYYGISGSGFDMGENFADLPMKESNGYAVSMWLRVDPTSRGFAYAVTDAFENVETGQFYTLDRLATIIESGGPEWFTTAYSVYQSLYVNGPGETLIFAYATPTDGATQLEFSLQEIGAGYLFNDQWHHVAITFVVENSKIQARLIVDGKTSYTKTGWSACVDSMPSAVAVTPSTDGSTRAKVFNHLTDRVTKGGVLVVGYFNGGVYRLQSHIDGPTLSTDFLPTATQVIRDTNTFPRQKTLILGSILVAFAAVLLIIVTFIGIRELHSVVKASTVAEYREASVTFYSAINAIFTGDMLFGVPQQPTDGSESERLKPIRLWVALRWANLNVEDFTEMMKEIAFQSKHPAESLALLLYCLRTKSEGTSFTVAEWNELVDKDENGGQCCSFISPGSDATADAKQDVIRCGDEDLFHQHFNGEGTVKVLDGNNANLDFVGQAGEEGLEKIGDLDIDFGSSSSAPATNSAGGGNAALETLAPVIAVFQGMHVWATSIEMPVIYNDTFDHFFSFLSIDFAATFPDVPTLVTPLVQLFVGLVVLGVVIYFMFEDDRVFESTVAKYVWRRDEVDANIARSSKLYDKVPIDTRKIIVEGEPANDGPVQTLPLSEARKLDSFLGLSKDEELEDLSLLDMVDINTAAGPAKVTKNAKGDLVAFLGSSSDECNTDPINFVGTRCPYHPSTRLTLQIQTTLWPFDVRPACCILTDGNLCGVDTEEVFSCGTEYEDEFGVKRVCTYALCGAHFRPRTADLVFVPIFTMIRKIRQNGLAVFICTISLALAEVAYTPFMKTALMIIGCHPYYQCEFADCWTRIDQKFAIAAFFSISVIAMLGLGLPGALLFLLHRRKSLLEDTFSAPEYEERYCHKSGAIKKPEWRRFVKTDMTALAKKYMDLDARWMYFPPVLVLLKIVALIPVIFVEPRTFEQRLGCAIVQMATSLLLFSTTPYSSPIFMITLRVAEVHQNLLLGFQNLDLVVRNDSNDDLAGGMVAITAVYIVFSAIVFVITAVFPVVSRTLRMKNIKKILKSFGFKHAASISIFFDPTKYEGKSAKKYSLRVATILAPK